MERKLYRSRSERMISGVCGGLAEYLSLDPTLVRVGVVLLAVVTQGGVVIAYLVMSIVVPEDPLEGPGIVEAAPQMTVHDDQGGTAMSETNDQATETSVPEPPAPPATSWTPTPASAPAPRKTWRCGSGVGFGVVLVLVGVLLLVNEFVPGVDVWRFWPLIIVAIGLSAVFKGVRR